MSKPFRLPQNQALNLALNPTLAAAIFCWKIKSEHSPSHCN